MGGLFGVCLLLLAALEIYKRAPLDPGRLDGHVSRVLLDRDGRLINLRLTPGGYWRQPVRLDDIAPGFTDMLLAYEDQHFMRHSGVDFKAVARAGLQRLQHGRSVSGASTLSMQLARLMHPGLGRKTLWTKARQMLFAMRIEHHMSKREILEAYLLLAPYGGNVEGITAAAYAWLQKSPKTLTPAEQALLVSLPQSPEQRRPDRRPRQAERARARVLKTVAQRLNFTENRVRDHLSDRVKAERFKPPGLAQHLNDLLMQSPGTKPKGRNADKTTQIKTTLDAHMQFRVQQILSASVAGLALPVNASALIVERRTGAVRAYVGSTSYTDPERLGAVNYPAALRSPGSTLKPFIYADALERGLLKVNHIFNDMPFQQEGYAPGNFNRRFKGEMSLRQALLTSSNIPAIQTLRQIGADAFEAKIRRWISEGSSQRGNGETGSGEINGETDGKTGGENRDATNRPNAGLSLAVGGFSMSAIELADLYLGLSPEDTAPFLHFSVPESPSSNPPSSETPSSKTGTPGLQYQSSGLQYRPSGLQYRPSPYRHETKQRLFALMHQDQANGRRITLKTGTSQNRQDAWTVLITRDHLVLTWFGTPDNKGTNFLLGSSHATPLALQIGQALGFQDLPVDPALLLSQQSGPVPGREQAAGHAPEQAGNPVGNPAGDPGSCDRLIAFPENGEWIVSDDLNIQIGGFQPGLQWFLNGTPVTPGRDSILRLKTAGSHKITARKPDETCPQTVEIFVAAHPGP